MHYYRWKRNGSPHLGDTMGRPPGSYKDMQFPYEVAKIDGEWHRRLTGSSDRWELVVWPERGPGQQTRDGLGFL